MPYFYHKGAKKAYKSGRSPVYSDTQSADTQKELERMLKEQIYRKTGYKGKKRKKYPKAWTDWLAKNTR